MKKEEKKEKNNKVAKTSDKKREKYIAENKKKVKERKKRVNLFKAIKRYFTGVIKEIKRIKWTTGKELLKYSIASVLLIIFFGVYFYAINWIALLVRSLAK